MSGGERDLAIPRISSLATPGHTVYPVWTSVHQITERTYPIDLIQEVEQSKFLSLQSPVIPEFALRQESHSMQPGIRSTVTTKDVSLLRACRLSQESHLSSISCGLLPSLPLETLYLFGQVISIRITWFRRSTFHCSGDGSGTDNAFVVPYSITSTYDLLRRSKGQSQALSQPTKEIGRAHV